MKRLLDDPRHGERWARHWMDVWRYSDWWGLGDQLRNSQKHIWHWRDWIVESLNADTPYDEMVRLMLAADELHPERPRQAAGDRLPRAELLPVQPPSMDGGDRRARQQGIPRPDDELREVPRPQVRPDLDRLITTGCGRSSSRITCGWTWCRAKPIWPGRHPRAFRRTAR